MRSPAAETGLSETCCQPTSTWHARTRAPSQGAVGSCVEEPVFSSAEETLFLCYARYHPKTVHDLGSWGQLRRRAPFY